MRIGTSYYPEMVDAGDWDRDLGLMCDAGLEVVRILDFAWSVIEPREGEYRWDWLDRFVEACDGRGMDVVMCTPTATPPAWLATQYPQIMIETREGQQLPFGARRDVDVCSPIYRDYSCEIARRMAERYGKEKRIIGWQIDNELCGAEHLAPESHTPDSNWRFKRWLRERYDSVEAINEAWYLTFWNQRWSDWGEITTPRPFRVTSGWTIDYSRFFSDMQAEFARLQYDEIKPRVHDEAWITHNSTAMFDRGLDHADMARSMDVAGWDAYLGAASAGHGYREQFAALATDWLRTATRKPVKIMETGARDCSIEYLELLARHGADLVLYFHWRAHRGNMEMGGGICGFDGEPYDGHISMVREATAWAKSATVGEPGRREAAFVFSVDNFRNHLHRPHFAKKTRPDYLDAMIPSYAAAIDLLGSIDVVSPGTGLAGYRLVIAPALRLLDEPQAEVLRDYVKSGGVLLATAKMAHQTSTGVYYQKPGGSLAEVLGFTVRKDCHVDQTLTIQLTSGKRLETEGWVDRCEGIEDGDVIGRFVDGPLDGLPALVRRKVGQGEVFFSAVTGIEAIRAVLPEVTEASGVARAAEVSR